MVNEVIEAVQSSLPIVVVAPSSLDRSLLLSGLLIDAQLAARGMEAHIDRSVGLHPMRSGSQSMTCGGSCEWRV